MRKKRVRERRERGASRGCQGHAVGLCPRPAQLALILPPFLASARIFGQMPSYRLGQAAKMLGVSADTVRRMVDDGRLRAARSSGGQRLVDGASLARLAKPAKRKPADVVVARSARNRFPGIITRVVKDRVAAQVEIQAGPHRLGWLTTRVRGDAAKMKTVET